MTSSLLRCKWFLNLVEATRVSRSTLDKSIENLTMRTLAKMDVRRVLEMAMIPADHSHCVQVTAQALSIRLALCGLIERKILVAFRRRKNVSREVLLMLEINKA